MCSLIVDDSGLGEIKVEWPAFLCCVAARVVSRCCRCANPDNVEGRFCWSDELIFLAWWAHRRGGTLRWSGTFVGFSAVNRSLGRVSAEKGRYFHVMATRRSRS
jgi:hypothetical protein